MSDLISRKDAIDKIREVYEYEFPTASGAFDEFVTVIIPNLLRNLPSAEPERKWIPVSEALPDEYIDVLLQFPHTMAVGYQEDGFWNIITCDDLYSGLDEEDEKPIAWMPLPEPYRKEN